MGLGGGRVQAEEPRFTVYPIGYLKELKRSLSAVSNDLDVVSVCFLFFVFDAPTMQLRFLVNTSDRPETTTGPCKLLISKYTIEIGRIIN